jgi:glycosyltransferase involved in cell wall biosynthesis
MQPAAPRILLVGPAVSGGGAENRMRLTAENMFAGKATVAVFEGHGLDALDSEARARALDLKWTGSFSYPAVIGRLRRHLRRERYDALMSFGFYPNLVAWAATRTLQKRPALVLTEINSMRREYEEARHTARGPLLYRLRRLILPRCDLFAANSEDGLREASTYFGVPSSRARRIPNLVEPSRLERLAAMPLEGAPDDGALSMCIVGRLFHRKRVDTLLRAGALLDRALPWRIDVVGKGEDRDSLAQLAHDLRIADRVRFHGWQANPYPFIRRAAVSVLCSEFEGFPNVVLEAMVLGSPVVTSLNTSDAIDMVDKGAALGFPIGDHDKLGAHLALLLADEDLRRDLSARARAYAQRHVLPGAIAEYEAVVADAIAIHNAET